MPNNLKQTKRFHPAANDEKKCLNFSAFDNENELKKQLASGPFLDDLNIWMRPADSDCNETNGITSSQTSHTRQESSTKTHLPVGPNSSSSGTTELITTTPTTTTTPPPPEPTNFTYYWKKLPVRAGETKHEGLRVVGRVLENWAEINLTMFTLEGEEKKFLSKICAKNLTQEILLQSSELSTNVKKIPLDGAILAGAQVEILLRESDKEPGKYSMWINEKKFHLIGFPKNTKEAEIQVHADIEKRSLKVHPIWTVEFVHWFPSADDNNEDAKFNNSIAKISFSGKLHNGTATFYAGLVYHYYVFYVNQSGKFPDDQLSWVTMYSCYYREKPKSACDALLNFGTDFVRNFSSLSTLSYYIMEPKTFYYGPKYNGSRYMKIGEEFNVEVFIQNKTNFRIVVNGEEKDSYSLIEHENAINLAIRPYWFERRFTPQFIRFFFAGNDNVENGGVIYNIPVLEKLEIK